MKTVKTYCALLGVAAVMASSNLFAGINYGDTGSITITGTDAPGGGGPMIAATSDLGTFITFCLEVNEHYTGATIYTINSGAIDGGLSGQTSPNFDPISIGTAYLYSQFSAGTLGAVSGYTTATEIATGVQQAIWYLEGEVGTENGFNYGVRNGYVDLAIAGLGLSTDSDVEADANGYGTVVVLNLTDANGGLHQDVLAVVPEPSTMVAGALLLLPFGMSTLRILRKKQIS